jgi:alanine-glyoxylate transaminase/serine-glyoxylate transaminase/serine-pyruvate transaminase
MTTPFTLSQGREYLAIPGPSVMPDAVLQAMHRASPNIYEGELLDLTATVVADLKKVARTSGDVAIYIGNGHAAWEAALANTIYEGDEVLVPATGRFGHGWAEVATSLGATANVIDFGRGNTVDIARLTATLRADTTHRIKAVLATHVDTSTSVKTDILAIRGALDAAGHPALLMVDCIASLGCDRFEMDAWGVDVMVAASQKGLMVPAGLGLVFMSPKANDVRAKMPRVSKYWDWAPRITPEVFYQYFCGTAPTHHLYGLRASLDMLMAEGMPAVWARHETLARAVWAACDVWAKGGALTLTVSDPAIRSHAVTALRLADLQATPLRRWVQDQIGLTLGIGLGMSDADDPKGDGYFRFGHMGHVNGQMIMGLLGGVDAGLRALNIPIGQGALDAAAQIISGQVAENSA